MMLATRVMHISQVLLYTTFQRISLYGQNGRVLIVDIVEIYSSMSSALCSVAASKMPVTNAYHWSNQRKITNEFS